MAGSFLLSCIRLAAKLTRKGPLLVVRELVSRAVLASREGLEAGRAGMYALSSLARWVKGPEDVE